MFEGLCDEIGTSQLVAMRRDLADICEMVENHVRTIDENSEMMSGSKREGFRLKGSDIDTMFWPNNHRVLWDLSQSQYYNTHRKTVTLILCDCSDSPPGFILLYLLSPSMDRHVQEACVRMKNRNYISSSKYTQIKCSESPFNDNPHGPCVSGIDGEIEYDNAYCFVSDFWPPSASAWIDRCQSWPRPHVVDDIVKNGCHLVAIGHKLGIYEDHEWRISFSLAENKLVCTMNHCQFLTYGLLKLFLTEIINRGLDDDDKLLCSYHMKTAVFWVIQQSTILHWCPQNLLGCFWVCFKLILKWVYEGVCPNFFIPANNMFLSKIYGEAQHQLFIRLYGLYEKGFVSLLDITSISSYIIDAIHNPRLSICTDEHALIPEINFDIELFYEMRTYGSSLELNDCIKYLLTLEHMISLPLLTQYQVVMLRRLAASFLQQTAFILNTEAYFHENKLRYISDKISRHMLNLAARFGCITDLMYIAMYYYKTHRYMEALSIIEMTKVKLSQPCLMNRPNVDAEKYIEAVGGQTWSTKMRQALACYIKLENRINYISELVPEQQSSLHNNGTSLYVPPFIMMNMLEVLCYTYVDTDKAQRALDDLQTLVHYDEGQLIPLDYMDITWTILEICQQVTRNL
ncbi:uncharacterized protein LOC134241041 [Saccostrea cucullata]|uniref:uncharacterized protein LOC134241041 n=1 Tax=Saccostrea cuccullata TaxID=36930 RepID=UPI002ED36EF1